MFTLSIERENPRKVGLIATTSAMASHSLLARLGGFAKLYLLILDASTTFSSHSKYLFNVNKNIVSKAFCVVKCVLHCFFLRSRNVRFVFVFFVALVCKNFTNYFRKFFALSFAYCRFRAKQRVAFAVGFSVRFFRCKTFNNFSREYWQSPWLFI